MANIVTGKTDTSGALSIAPKAVKSVLIVGANASALVDSDAIFSISGTDDAKAKFGEDSPVVKMVRILITNGVDNIKGMVIPKHGLETEYATVSDAYSHSLNVSLGESSVKCILCDTNEKTVIMAVKTHLTLAESNDLFRYAVFAPDSTKTTQDELTAFATEIDSSRIFVPGPAVVDTSANVLTSGVYAMAGLTSLIMTETSDPALPMNGVSILGLGGVNRNVIMSERKILADNGVTALYTDAGYPTVHRLVTSAKTDKAIWQEGTTRFIADDVLESVETTLKANFKRTKNVARVLDAIKTTVKGVLETKAGLEIIEDFDASTLSVVKDPEDMYGALVSYDFDVVTPLYTITITQSMKL